MTRKTPSKLVSDIATRINDNSSGDISAQDVRESLNDIVDTLPYLQKDTDREAFIAASQPTTRLNGLNLTAGGNGIGVPGQGHGFQYLYPSYTQIDYYAALGFNYVRLQFKWENLQKALYADLDNAELALLDDRARYCVSKGMFVEIEPHNYAQYNRSPTATTGTITGATKANPCVITYGTGTFLENDTITIASVGGMTQLNGNTYKVKNLNTTTKTFELTNTSGVNINSTAYGTYTSGGTTTHPAVGYYIGSPQVPTTAFSDFWAKVAMNFLDEPMISFGLCNEPTNLSADWFPAAQAAIMAIRATGAANRLGIPGTGYTGGHVWFSSLSAYYFNETIRDPLNNFYIDIHNYMDNDNAGDSNEVAYDTSGPERIQKVTEWARAYGYKCRHGETNAGDNSSTASSTAIKALLELTRYEANNADVWEGISYWCGGQFFSDSYLFQMNPIGGVGSGNPDRDRTVWLATEKQNVFPRASCNIDVDFKKNKIFGVRKMTDIFTVTQAGETYAPNSRGFELIPPNTLRRTDMGLLTEESRTNRLTSYLWRPSSTTNVTLTRGILAPDGTNTAVRMTDSVDVSAVAHRCEFGSGEKGSISNGTALYLSIWAKQTVRNSGVSPWLTFSSPSAWAYNDLDSFQATQPYIGDWQRVGNKFASYTDIGFNPRFGITPDGQIGSASDPGTYQGAGNKSIEFWCPQLETGIFPTTPIPVYKKATTATRAVDVVELVGNAKDIIDGDFTMVFEIQYCPEEAVALPLLTLRSSGPTDTVALRRNTDYSVGGLVGTTQTTSVPSQGASAYRYPRKVGISIRRSGTARVVIGLENVSAVGSNQTIPAHTNAYIGPANCFINNIQLYDAFYDTTALDTLLLAH